MVTPQKKICTELTGIDFAFFESNSLLSSWGRATSYKGDIARMSKDMKTVEDMIDYVRQLRLHTEGRRSIHVKLSRLEKHFREEHYRRFTASALRPLVTNFGATIFALPTADLVLIVKDAKVDSIDTLLNNVRRKFKDSELIKQLDPVQGTTDAFVEWFELEEEYDSFRKYIEALGSSILDTVPQENAEEEVARVKKPASTLEDSPSVPERLSPSKKMKMVPIDAPKREVEDRDFDPELVVQIVKAIGAADVGGLLKKQNVKAVLPNGQQQDVIVHKYVPREVVFEKLLDAPVTGENVWLDGYVTELLASRLLFSAPTMENDSSIASSIRATVKSMSDGSFDEFAGTLGRLSKSKVIVELSAQDVLTHFDQYQNAHAKLELSGFRVMIADVDLTALLWLNYESFEADFVKTRLPYGPAGEWLSEDLEHQLKTQIKRIGQARVILDGCNSSDDIELGIRLGITLFQGNAIEPYTS